MNLRGTDRLYLITDRHVTPRPLVDVVREAVEGGVPIVQLREKDLSDGDFLELAHPLRRITAQHDARLLLNGRWELVGKVGADGVHLPSGSSIPAARDALGPDRVIGYSAHDVEELQRAESDGADFVALGPVFPTASKPGADTLGLVRFAELCRSASLPVFALGGVMASSAAPCVEAGAFGVAVVRGILAEADVGSAVEAYLHALPRLA